MAHYIDKDAVLAEIESLKDSVPYFPTIAEKEAYRAGVDGACCKIYSLEVREVDLETEIEEQCNKVHQLAVGKELRSICKHFFELGLRASNPLTWEDIRIIGKLRLDIALELRRKELESPDFIKFTEEDYCNEVLKRFKETKKID